jgi:AcrR family transcriptional regulator
VAVRRRSTAATSETRSALLDAAERLMLDEGYAAVTARRVAAGAGFDVGLVYYYFANMDDLFLALFRRGADARLELQETVLASSQPLWGLWDLTHQQTDTSLTLEFIALANHRKAIRTEIADSLRKFRTMQLETMSTVLEGYGIDPIARPPASIILPMWGISQYLLIEQAFDLDTGHAETIALIEREITALEGPRRSSPDERDRHVAARLHSAIV